MTAVTAESLVELASFLLSVAAAGLLTAVGALTDSAGLANVLAGQSMLGLWELWMGTLALYAGLTLLRSRHALGRFTSAA